MIHPILTVGTDDRRTIDKEVRRLRNGAMTTSVVAPFLWRGGQMIKVSRTNRRILVDGHAHYAPSGQDIVCSAVSALTQTLAVALQTLTDDLRGVEGMDVEPSPGLVSIWIKDEQSDTAKTLIDAYMLGISGIENSYPDHVRIIKNENAEGANATVAGTIKERKQ